jgi:hypothetical protein
MIALFVEGRPCIARWLSICALVVLVTCAISAGAQDASVATPARNEHGNGTQTQEADSAAENVNQAEANEADEVETLTPAERAAALERRAGERGPSGPRGRALILGMHIQEGPKNRVKVIEVSAASPAFDAGVKAGDEIVSVDGFHAKTYREWIDGIRRMVTDTPDGELMAFELLRGGKRVAANIRAPESRADDPRLPGLLGQPIPPLDGSNASGGSPFGPTANQPVGAAGNNVFINNAPFNNAFNAGLAGTIDRAIAQIVRIEQQQTADDVGQAGSAAAARPAGQPRQFPDTEAAPVDRGTDATSGAAVTPPGSIGIAGFRDEQSGMLVMMDVGGLAPGNYRVSIKDPGRVFGGTDAAPVPNSVEQTLSVQQPGQRNQPTEDETSAAGTPPTGQVNPPTTPATGQVNPPATPPTGRVTPSLTPPTGKVNPPATSPTGDPNTGGGSRSGSLPDIGILTIDQSGTGTMQQTVAGMFVRDVAGQAIVIYAPEKPPQGTAPASPKASGVRTGAAADPGAAPSQPNAADSTQIASRAGRPVPGTQLQTESTATPVAAGVIQLLSESQPATTATSNPTNEQVSPTEPQAAGTDQNGVVGDPSERPITR